MLKADKKQPTSISRERSEQVNLDFEAMRQLGQEWLQQLSGDSWTDYNIHDPGVTILENLCYGLLDLSYRTEFPVDDILFAATERVPQNTAYFKELLSNQGFHLPEDTFPTGALTISDFRKLILDRFREVKNVWIESVKLNEFGIEIQGLYKVYIQLGDVILDETDREQLEIKQREVASNISAFLDDRRNLCERFISVEIPKKVEVSLELNVEMSFTSDIAYVKAQIFFKLFQQLSKVTPRSSRQTLTEEGWDNTQIFEGPRMLNGFIKDEDLKGLNSTIITAELKEIIAKVDGIIRIIDFSILVDGVSSHDETITFNQYEFPILNVHVSKINIENLNENSGLAVTTLTAHYLSLMITRAEKGYYPALQETQLRNQSTITKKQLKKYHSIQQLFPAVYGIDAFGLGLNARRKDLAAAKQLKAFLLLPEQIIADALAQLSNIPALFALNLPKKQSYFVQHLDNDHLPRIQELFDSEDTPNYKNDEPSPLEIYHKKSEELSQKMDDYYQRKNQFLNHLLARFGESLRTEELERMVHASINTTQTTQSDDSYHNILEHKATLIKNYPAISSHRAKAGVYPVKGQDYPANIISGAIEKIQQKLLLDPRVEETSLDEESKNLYWLENILLYPRKEPQYNIRLLDSAGNMILENNAKHTFGRADSLVDKILFFGIQVENQAPKYWSVKPSQDEDDKYRIILSIPKIDENTGQTIEGITDFEMESHDKHFESEEAALGRQDGESEEWTIWRVVNYLREAKSNKLEDISSIFELAITENTRDFEQIFRGNTHPKLKKILSDPGEFFFNHRISLIFPAWKENKYFNRPEFQQHVERIAYECFPVHLAIDFYWFNQKQEMQRFEEAYHNWLNVYACRFEPHFDLTDLDEKANEVMLALFPDPSSASSRGYAS
jgi:hypothetical protein